MKNIEIARSLIKKFNNDNKLLYLVGGSTRDYLLYGDFTDFDFATPLTPNEVISFLNLNKVDEYALKFGTVKTIYQGVKLEITTFRVESGYENNRKPSKVKFTKILKIDAIRRDFTINAMYMDNEKIIDIYNSQDDLKNKILRTVRDADIEIKEDALRILRALRFSLTHSLTISLDLRKAIIDNRKLLLNLSTYKIEQELKKVPKNTPHFKIVRLAKQLRIYSILKSKTKLI